MSGPLSTKALALLILLIGGIWTLFIGPGLMFNPFGRWVMAAIGLALSGGVFIGLAWIVGTDE